MPTAIEPTSHSNIFAIHNKTIARFARPARRWFTFPSAIAGLCLLGSFANPANALSQKSVEQWVYEQTTSGKVADLRERFPDPKHRVISASFIRSLLTTKERSSTSFELRHAVIRGSLDMSNQDIPQSVKLEWCDFEGDVDFSFARFGRSISFNSSVFRQDFAFGSAEVSQRLTFSLTRFMKRAYFEGANVGALVALGPEFIATDEEISFAFMHVASPFGMPGAIANGYLSFRSLAAEGLALQGLKAMHPEITIDFQSIRIAGLADISDATFAGNVDFTNASIGTDLAILGSTFLSTKTSTFAGTTVGRIFRIRRTAFASTVYLVAAKIHQGLYVEESIFSHDRSLTMNNARVTGDTLLRDTTFRGEIDISEAHLGTLTILSTAATGKRQRIADLSLESSTVDRFLMIEGVDVAKLNSTLATVKGRFGLKSINILEEAIFDYASMRALIVPKSTWWPTDAHRLSITGMTYKGAFDSDGQEDHRQMLRIIDQAKFTTDAYVHLEKLSRRLGDPGFADDVYVQGKWRERKERLHGFAWWRNLLSWAGIRYGKNPEIAFVWAVLFWISGCVVFRSNRMEASSKDGKAEPYMAFIYSLDLLLPFINLGMRDQWRPRNNQQSARIYMRAHIIAGWILIPLGLAALTGLIE